MAVFRRSNNTGRFALESLHQLLVGTNWDNQNYSGLHLSRFWNSTLGPPPQCLTFVLFCFFFPLPIVSCFFIQRLYFCFISVCASEQLWRLLSWNVLHQLFCYVNAPSSNFLNQDILTHYPPKTTSAFNMQFTHSFFFLACIFADPGDLAV